MNVTLSSSIDPQVWICLTTDTLRLSTFRDGCRSTRVSRVSTHAISTCGYATVGTDRYVAFPGPSLIWWIERHRITAGHSSMCMLTLRWLHEQVQKKSHWLFHSYPSNFLTYVCAHLVLLSFLLSRSSKSSLFAIAYFVIMENYSFFCFLMWSDILDRPTLGWYQTCDVIGFEFTLALNRRTILSGSRALQLKPWTWVRTTIWGLLRRRGSVRTPLS